MIGTVMRIGWIGLKRDRVAQALTFALPIAFFSIFAGIFANQGRGSTAKVQVAVVDEDGSELSRRLVAGLKKEASLRVTTAAKSQQGRPDTAEVPLDREAALALVRAGSLPVAIILPRGLGASFPNFEGQGAGTELLADTSDPVAPQLVSGLFQKILMTSAPDLIMKGSMAQFEHYAGAFTEGQQAAIDRWLPMLKSTVADEEGANQSTTQSGDSDSGASGTEAGAGMFGMMPVKVVDVLGEKKTSPVVSFYAAGTGVMFLLFMCSGAGGSLLEEVESGTLDRLLSSSLGMNGLLAGKWLFLTTLGILQVTVMFVWGALVFKLDLWSHLFGFALMTAFTSAAAAGFGLVLATACRSRAQLSGISTIVILSMSAVGGSMFPRFLMSDTLQKFGLITFNAWALDGYVKVFWRDVAFWELWPQLLVLSTLAVVFMVGARLLAHRWETV